MRGSHGLSAQRARRTKSGGPKGLQLEFGAQRAPRLLVVHISWHCILVKLHFCILGETVFLSVPGGEDEEGLGGDQHPAGGHCPQPQEETPGRELCCSYFLFDMYQNVPNIILLDINFPLGSVDGSTWKKMCFRTLSLRCPNKLTNWES